MNDIKIINNISPLRYPGGKTRACKVLDKILIKHFNINNIENIISPFFGGGSFEFFLQNNYKVNLIVNDKFKPLYSFWNQCKSNKNNLIEEIKKNKDVDKEKFKKFREEIIDLEDELKQGSYFFIINRCSFSGATLSGGFSLESSKKRFTDSSIEKINKLNLSKVEFYNLDYKEFIKLKCKNIEGNSLIFLDPPYYLEEKSNLYGNNGDMHETFNHDKLYRLIKNKKNWIMTYNNCTYIKNLYKNFIIVEAEWSYGMNKTKESSEIIIISK